MVQPLECDWVAQDVQVSIYVNDTSKKFYDDQASGTTHPPAGLGDEAVWYQPVAYAQKEAALCRDVYSAS